MDDITKNIKVERILNGKLSEMCYLIHKPLENKCICVDPGYEVDRIMQYIEKNNYIIDTILLTHGHFDHMLSCKVLQDKFNSKIYISKIDEKILYNSEQNYSFLINVTEFDKLNIYKYVEDNEIIDLLGFTVICISTPGHTKGSFCFYFENEKVLFSGDTLFKNTYGRVDLFSGDFDDMEKSVYEKLFTLPDDTLVYPGHGENTYISYEKLNNDINRSDFL